MFEKVLAGMRLIREGCEEVALGKCKDCPMDKYCDAISMASVEYDKTLVFPENWFEGGDSEY